MLSDFRGIRFLDFDDSTDEAYDMSHTTLLIQYDQYYISDIPLNKVMHQRIEQIFVF